MTVRSLAAVLLLVAVLAAGCAAGNREADAGPGEDSTSSGSTSTERTASIYAAVVRQLVTKDHTFGGADPGFTAIYLIDGAVPGAADPTTPLPSLRPAERFPSAVKQALVKKLSDLPPLEFVSRRSNAIEGDNGGSSPGRVRNGGVLITLGPIRATGHPVAVGASLWINGLAGSWQTYVLKARTGRWLVTGTAGPTAIS